MTDSKTLLLVEDEFIVAQAEMLMLRRYGFVVYWAANGLEAIKLVDSLPQIDLALIDVDLGSGIDGADTAQHILQTHDLPVVFLSNHSEPEVVEKAERTASYGYLAKYSEETVIVASLRMALKLHDAHRRTKNGGGEATAANRELQGALERLTLAQQGIEKANEELRRSQAELLQRDQALFESQRSLGLAVDGAELGMWDWNVQTGAIVLNDRWSSFLGIPLEAMPHTFASWEMLVHPDDRTIVMDKLNEHLEGRSPVFSAEQRLRHHTGEWRWFLARGKVIERDHDGKLLRVAGTHRDITEQKRREAKVQESEERYRVLMENAAFPVVVSSLERGDVVFMNSVARDLFHAEKSEKASQREDVLWQDPLQYEKFLVKLLRFGTVRGFEAEVLRAPGERLRVLVSANLVEFGGGRASFSVYDDITDRTRMEEELRESNERYQSLFQSTVVAVYVHDLEGRFIDANNTALELLGVSRDELPSLSLPLLIDPSQMHDVLASLHEIKRNGHDSAPRHYRLRHNNGRTVWIETEGTLIRQGTKPDVVYSVARNITERIEAEQRLSRQNLNLTRINKISLDLASLAAGEDLRRHIARILKEHTDAIGVTAGEYVLEEHAIRIVHLETDFSLVDTLRSFNGVDIGNIVSPVDDKTYQQLLKGELGQFESLTDVTFGAVPHAVSAVVKSVMNVDRFLTIGYVYEGALYGTSVLAFSEGTVLPEADFLKSFAAVAAVSLRRAKIERDLRESEERFRSFHENTLMGIYRSTPEGKIVMANPALIAMLGCSSFEELAGMNLEQEGFAASYRRQTFKDEIERDGRILGHEAAWKRRDGTTVFIREGARAIRDAAGAVLYYDGTVEDITGQKRAEEALERSASEKEAQFRELQHRVKNSMATIRSLISLEEGRWKQDDVKKVLQTIGDRVGSIASLYDMLYTSGPSQEIRLDEYVRHIAGTLIRAYGSGERGVMLEMGGEALMMDTRRAIPLGLITNELVTNALKHAFEGKQNGKIWVSVEKRNSNLILEVADDGIGLPASFSLTSSAGMGSQLVGMLVDQIGGSLTWETGQRTKFIVSCPLSGERQ